MKQTFQYCALKYLLLWERAEHSLHEAIKENPSSDDLRRAMRHFGVARNFKDISDNANADSVITALKDVGTDAALSPNEKVERLAAAFKVRFNHSNLSAASKLLWLRYRHPHIIFDARANSALKLLNPEFDGRNRDYAEYASAWRTEFNKCHPEVCSAVEQLSGLQPSLQPFMPAGYESTKSIDPREFWFVERVFDIYLWELGGGT